MTDILSSIREIWPDWEILEQIGEGAYSSVYRARQKKAPFDEAAIKVLQIPGRTEEVDYLRAEGLSDQQIQEYFQEISRNSQQEIEWLTTLHGQRHIVAIDTYAVRSQPNQPGCVILIRMELLVPLVRYAALNHMSEAEIIQLGIDICDALRVCHQAKIVHQDIKPENIFVSAEDGWKLGDFGIARSLVNQTSSLSWKGTPNYMAPEVYTASISSSNDPAAIQADIYSLGLVLYWLSNQSRLPFVPTDRQIISLEERHQALLRRVSGEPLPPPVNASPALRKIILRACAFHPQARYRGAEELKDDLTRLQQSGMESERREGSASSKNLKKRWAMLCAAAAVLVLAAAGIFVLAPEMSSTPAYAPAAILTATPTPMPSSVPTVAATLTPMSSPAAAPTATPTLSPTSTPAPTITPTSSLTPTPSPTPSPSPSPTPSPTPAPTPTPSPSPSPTPSPTPTPTPTPSPTPTPTPSPSPSPSPSPTPTPEPTPTPIPDIKGDINGDGTVTLKDAVRLMRYLNGEDVKVVQDHLDVNMDGNVDEQDVDLLHRYLAGWESILP